MAADQVENEWSDEFGDHWECKQRSPDGAIHSVVLTRDPSLGWPSRHEARDQVRACAALYEAANTGGNSA